ncbi:hypothetical protein BJ138DRAFT_1058085 [Hygrophoropsis aurantiaca]|uniref:Uncharacterized protein n=1 Tax=Hygrophoropsis aurantiaca TaxID=72124 RepID=A0ACB8ALS2_9AGAM|nr:hypothetical protein BJ138DRAFT_1058085 [Hygrophoropsis aurantiaca]
MFSCVARLRHITPLLLLLSPLVSAKDDSLFTSSVTYCAQPQTLLIQQFDLAYFAKNSSIWFNISAASVEPNVNVSANIMLNVYGMHTVNFTIDLCSLFNGALCPLPMYNFTGSDSIPLPSSLGVTNKIPGIAYKIPDLEAYAQLSLNDVSTGELKACVQATLSNGWSAHQVSVEWATGGLALLALFSAIGYSLSPEALAPYRLFDLFYLYQWAASTAFLNLNYSSVYRAFATNFAWAMGLFSATASSSIQLSINNMRHLTGGNMADATGGSAVALVNRKLSPYNAVSSSSYVAPTSGIAGFGAENLFAIHNSTVAKYTTPSSLVTVHDFSSAGQVQLVTESSTNVLEAGVPIYVNSVGIATANAFMTIFLVALMLAAIMLTILGLGYVVITVAGRHSQHKDSRYVEWKYRFPSFARAWLLRVCLIVFTPVTIFALYQWTLKDSWLSILLSVILLLSVVGYLLYPMVLTVRLALRSTPYSLYTQTDHLNSHGPLYALYRTQRYFASIPLLVAIFLKSIFIAFAQANGEVQLIFILIVECGILACLSVTRPHKTRGADALAIYLAITRVVCTGLMVAFLESLNLAAIPRVAIGIVIAVIISVAVIVMFFNTLVNLGLIQLLFAKFRGRPIASANPSVLEKGGDASDHSGESRSPFGRPRNPTPERNIPLDPDVRQTYPASPSHTTDRQSAYSDESGSTTLGSLLPRRWSFQPSHPSHSRSNSNSQSQSQSSPLSTNFLSTASSPRQSHPPSPLYTHSQSHSRQPTIDEHGPSL